MEPLLFNLTSEPDVIVRTEVLGVVSLRNICLIKHHKPGVIAVRQENGYGALMEALGSNNVRKSPSTWFTTC
ncbi:hypothetical protein MKW94_026970 [Papaver nudicaule]|uniref:Uncharacterized protein n=1 Tax=Papaver nudicaule TaxID=74823 RepID=A0AA41W197_PAPNU|nr:hypothetical protein [Papaver nudicaule]